MSWLALDLRTERFRKLESDDDMMKILQEMVDEGVQESDLLLFNSEDKTPILVR